MEEFTHPKSTEDLLRFVKFVHDQGNIHGSAKALGHILIPGEVSNHHAEQRVLRYVLSLP